jgi:hypothetical protein
VLTIAAWHCSIRASVADDKLYAFASAAAQRHDIAWLQLQHAFDGHANRAKLGAHRHFDLAQTVEQLLPVRGLFVLALLEVAVRR